MKKAEFKKEFKKIEHKCLIAHNDESYPLMIELCNLINKYFERAVETRTDAIETKIYWKNKYVDIFKENSKLKSSRLKLAEMYQNWEYDFDRKCHQLDYSGVPDYKNRTKLGFLQKELYDLQNVIKDFLEENKE